MSTRKSSLKLFEMETRKAMAKTTEPTDAGPSRQSSTQRIKSSRSSRDHLDDPVPTSLPTYPEVVPLEDEGAYRHQPEMASPPSSHGYPYQQERRYDQPPLDAYPQLHRDSDVTTSQALKVRHEGPSRSMRYAWHRTRLGFRGSSMILFYAALLTAIGRLSDAVRGDDYVDFWGNWVGDWRYGWCMVLITLGPVALLWNTAELLTAASNGRGIHLWAQTPSDFLLAGACIGSASWLMADANFGSKGLPVGIILLVAGFCHAFLFGLNIVALMRKPKAGYMV